MGLLSGDETRAGKKSKKGKWSFKSLFASNLRSKTLPRELSEPAPGQRTPSSPQAAAPVAGISPLPATPSAARQPGSRHPQRPQRHRQHHQQQGLLAAAKRIWDWRAGAWWCR